MTECQFGASQWPTLIRCAMSALGQKQTSAHVRMMSALPPKADIGSNRKSPNGMVRPCSGPASNQSGPGAPKTRSMPWADAPTNSRHANRSSPSLSDMCLVKARDHQFIISCSQFGRDSKF